MKRFLTIIVSAIFVGGIDGHEPCPYGQPCFLPAPPGKTPSCALPGITYCEHPAHYPRERIHFLVQQWRLNHGTILIDESREDFNAYLNPLPHLKYGPPNTLKQDGYSYPEPIYIPKPTYTFDEKSHFGNSYIPPKFNSGPYNYTANYNPQGKTWHNYKYTTNIPALPHFNHGRRRRRRAELITKNLRKLKSLQFRNNSTEILNRRKRQASGGGTLCTTRSQFVMPRAALNNQGNWMYVVNMPEMSQMYTQLVKSETCVSQTCSSLCGLPLGYTSRCDQRYIQKRLVALEGSGNELYNDLFWIPSCCVCTLSNN